MEHPENERHDSWPDDDANRMQRVEAVLFLSKEPMNSRKLSELADLEDGTQARTLIQKLNQRYDRTGKAFQVKQVAGGYQLMTRPQFAPWLRQIEYTGTSLRLSPPALETLAVVAYRQPVLKAEIESIRGVGCGELLRQLMERNLVKIAGRSSELGNPFLYATTRNFLKTFGLGTLDQLPRAAKLRGREILGESQKNQPPNGLSSESLSTISETAHYIEQE
ncbi:MAG TPA: SMC-Scp complex subunit ScpB [Pirellulaceae bacterium]|nr:SMC-Scp complex subunit ScpB [Pirellulaceae bacterium]HMO91351.1 SMC-Scp complex subunit ScpB [Pirellulaceae bacterium]HMP70257.1 SMC-Scp complex subunit ScpB [Pirellulaceae bacterium]